jgi:hypothetical protein
MKNFCGDSIINNAPLLQSEDGGVIPTSPLQLQIRQCNVHLACGLNALWHSRFPKIDWSNVVRNKRYICFVAEHCFINYATAIWSSPIAGNRLKDSNQILELRRLAISKDAPKNTASRMLSIMIKIIRKSFPEITRFISYQDTDVHLGTIYRASGWTASALGKFQSWTNDHRSRGTDQSKSSKVRWEYI